MGIEQLVSPPQREPMHDRSGLVSRTWFQFVTALYRRGLWTPVTFDAALYTASDSMTWTVGVGGQVTLAYTLNGKTLTIAFTLRNTTVGGTLSNELQIAIPSQFTAAREMHNAVLIQDNGVRVSGRAYVSPDGTVVGIRKEDGSNFVASTNATDVEGQLAFEVKGGA